MPEIETGDILFMDNATFGHIGMAYSSSTIIHAQMEGNFHKSHNDQYDVKKQQAMPSISNSAGVMVFRPPWDKCNNAAARKTELQAVADAISKGAKYGAYRAVRLLIGSSEFGPDAYGRFMKYRERYNKTKGTPDRFGDAGKEVIKTVTCSEAVIVTYQLTFPLQESPFFIRLDAAHAMPRTLRDWLKINAWTHVT